MAANQGERLHESWAVEELYQILASGNSITEVGEHLRQIEIDQLNAEIRADSARRYAEGLPIFENNVANHERLSAEDVENYGIPPGYKPDFSNAGDFFVWR